jgi:hypothetical protein
VVASDIAAARELFSDGHDGLLFPVGHPSALADVVGRALGQPAWLAQIARQAVVTASTRSATGIVARYAELLRETAARRVNVN